MLSVQNLSVSFGENKILHNINLDASLGSTIGIIGPNGSGKTTLFNAICGYVSSATGKISVNNIDISVLPAHQRANAGICRVFQSPGIFKELSLVENLIISLTAKDSITKSLIPIVGSRKSELLDNAMYYLSLVSLEKNPNQKAGALSGGQMRLLEMARALSMQSLVYLLDEPTAGVSPKLKDQVSEAIRQIMQLGKIVLVIEHDMNFIRSFVERIVVLDQGTIYMDDLPDNVMKSERLKDIYFGSAA
jgi:ABC-type branched-subunit amino acid transport system ATPase component